MALRDHERWFGLARRVVAETAFLPVSTTGWGGGTPPSNNALDRLRARVRRSLATPRSRAIAGAGAVVVLAGTGLAVARVTSSDPPPTTTTTTTAAPTTTKATTTTTARPTWPLTGRPLANPAQADHPALAVKIDNVQPNSRPQIGLNQADIVYEERVEGAVTRFMAVFHSSDAQPVGPIRSARTSDIGLFSPFGRPLFAWSGANPTFAARVRAASIVDVGYQAAPSHYHRTRDRRAPHNLMLNSVHEMWAIPGATVPKPIFTYRKPGTPVPGQPIKGVHIVFATGAGSAPVDYRWNGKGWARSQSGTPHVDAAGQQVAPENVIISFTPYANTGIADMFGNPVREARTTGKGDAWVLTGGKRILAHWVKPTLANHAQYLDGAGRPIPLTPGRTWVALAEPGTTTVIP